MVPAPDEGRLDETRPFKRLSPGTMISHYKIAEKIGEGGMGVVYKATDTRLDRTVALKFLPSRLLCDSEATERFEHEAKAASALNHPNIATIFEIDQEDGRCFIVMEYLEGGSLKGLLKADDLSLKEILNLAIQMGEGLSAAHENGVTHRDMKPDNIMLTRKGRPKITDFGLAKLRGATKVTKTGTTLGTLQYMSPEQAGGEAVDSRSDIFSFGVILYEMVTGKLPFRGENEAAVISSLLNDTPEPLARYKADLPEGFQRMVDRALTKDPEERYQHADDMVAELKHEKRLLETGTSTVTRTRGIRPTSRRRLLPVLIPAAIAVAVILFVLVFEPFRIEMGPGKEASAQENSLAVMYFENMVDPDDTDKTSQMVTALLITDLSESEYMRVLNRQRLYDILTRMGEEDKRVIDKSVASRVAMEAGVRWILTGTVLQVEPTIILASEIADAETGEIRASQRVNGETGEDLFAVIDKLTIEVREDLSLPEDAKTEEDRGIADVTTHSQEAYRFYLEGVDLEHKYYFDKARDSFRRAVEHDSTFAMALYHLSALIVGEERKALLEKALEHSANATRSERYYIEAYEAFDRDDYDETIRRLQRIIDREPDHKMSHFTMAVIYIAFLGEPDLGVHHCKKTLEIDPLFKRAYNQMAYAYHTLGDHDSSLWAINNYIALAPDEANPYDTRGDLYAYGGQLDRALDSYGKADEIKPGFSTLKLGHICLYKGLYAQAESCYKVMASGDDKWNRCEARTYLAIIPIYRGEFEEALQVLDRGIGADEMEQAVRRWHADKHRLATIIHLEREEYDAAAREALRTRDALMSAYPENMPLVADFYGHAIARAGRIEAAEEALRELEDSMKESALSRTHSYWVLKGNIARYSNNLSEAIRCYEKGLDVAAVPHFHIRSMLGEAYLEAGRLDKAVGILEQAVSRYDEARLLAPVRAVKAHYTLARAYEESGWADKAIEQYETFLDIWKDADPGIPVLEDARQRLARLKSGA